MNSDVFAGYPFGGITNEFGDEVSEVFGHLPEMSVLEVTVILPIICGCQFKGSSQFEHFKENHSQGPAIELLGYITYNKSYYNKYNSNYKQSNH